jgi:hypothetical protein
MPFAHVKSDPGLQWQKRYSTKRRLFASKLNLNLRKKLVKYYTWSIASENRSEIPGKF